MEQVVSIVRYKKQKDTKAKDTHSRAYGKHISIKEIKRKEAELLSQPKTEKSLRDIALFYVLLSTGARRTEICNLDYSKSFIDEHSGCRVFRVRGKGNYVNLYILDERALQAVKNYLEFINFPLTGKLFYSLPKIACKYPKRNPLSPSGLQFIVREWKMKSANNKPVHTHSFRSSVGVHLFQQKQDIGLVAKKLNHRNINTTNLYYTNSITTENIVF